MRRSACFILLLAAVPRLAVAGDAPAPPAMCGTAALAAAAAAAASDAKDDGAVTDAATAQADPAAEATAPTDEAAAEAVDDHDHAGEAHAEAGAIPIELLRIDAAALASGLADGTMRAVDVNTARTRASNGIIPGAILVDDAETAPDALGEISAEQTYVFYCYNQSCLASDRAATVTAERGVARVAILPAGIRGWVSAGHDVEPGPAFVEEEAPAAE